MCNIDKIKFKLNNRANCVISSRNENFKSELKMFYEYINSECFLKAILLELEKHNFNVDDFLGNSSLHKRFIAYPDIYLDKIYLCNYILKSIYHGDMGLFCPALIHITSSSSMDDKCNAIAKQYFIPFYNYLLESISDSSTMLYLLDRYRHRSEWFHKYRLFNMFFQDTKHGEDFLTLDLQEYLNSQGIDYPFSTPSSPSGRTDVIGLIDTPDPLVLEVKIFNLANNYDKSYIRKGLTQAYRYAVDYGKPIGYLLIFNIDERTIGFEKNNDEVIKSIQIGEKIIYIICVDIFCDDKTASQKKKPLPYNIDDSYLKNIEEE